MKDKVKDFLSFTDSLPVGVLLVDASKKILYINEVARELSGYINGEIKGQTCDLLFGKSCGGKNDCFLIGKNPKSERRQVELLTRSGGKIVVDKIEKLITSSDGKLEGCIELISPAAKDERTIFELMRENEQLLKNSIELKNLLNVGLIISSSLSIHRILLRIINTLNNDFNYENICVLMPDESDNLEVVAMTRDKNEDNKSEVISAQKSIAGRCFESREPILVNDILNQTDYFPLINTSHSELAVPIIFQDKILGVLIATSEKPVSFSKSDIDFLSTVTNFAAAAINNALMTNEIKDARDQYEVLFNESSDPILITDTASLKFFDCNLRATEVYGYTKEELLKIPPARLIFQDASHAENLTWAFTTNWEGKHITKNNSVIYVESRSTIIDYAGTNANLTIVRNMTERKKLEEELKRLSVTDELTKLYNRHHFINTLNTEVIRATRYKYPLTLMMIDVDNFKHYNDSYGHQAGDKLLVKLGSILQETLRSTDIPCRYGGDEFSIILPHIFEKDSEKIALRVLDKYILSKFENTSLSIGIASLSDGDNAEALIHKADQALYFVKKNLGRGNVSLFSKVP